MHVAWVNDTGNNDVGVVHLADGITFRTLTIYGSPGAASRLLDLRQCVDQQLAVYLP